MLIFKDLEGNAGGPEHTALKGLLAVGSEFMTERSPDSEVQRSGEFVTMRRRASDPVARLATIWEPPDALRRTEAGFELVTDDQPEPTGEEYVLRSAAAVAMVEPTVGGDQPFEPLAASKPATRLHRFVRLLYPGNAHALERVEDVDHATKDGKRRLFSLGDGTALVVKEFSDPGDARFFMGVNTVNASVRRARVARVDLLRVDPLEPNKAVRLMTFQVHSGLGFDPGQRAIFTQHGGDGSMYDSSRIYAMRSGVLWGRLIFPFRGDPSASYAVAEPAMAQAGSRTYLSLVAVHGLPEDSPDLQGSALTSLTCTYTTPEGTGTSKIPLPALTEVPDQFWSAVEMDLLRLAPTTLVLNVQMASQMSPGAAEPTQARLFGGRAFYWSDDNGETWVLLDTAAFLDASPSPGYGTMLARDKDTALVFSNYQTDNTVSGADFQAVAVYTLGRAGAARIGTILGSQFSAGLHAGFAGGPGGSRSFPPYISITGGGVRVRSQSGGAQRLWMQFDPQYINRKASPGVIDYPSSRAMLMVSDDGGATWARQFFPQPWPQRVGFAVAIDETTMVVPVYNARRRNPETGSLMPVLVQFYVSKDGGRTWRGTQWRLRLPSYAWVDGQLLPDSPLYEILDGRSDFNRGELFPLIVVRGDDGQPAPMNPGRPWIAHYAEKEPENG